MGSELNTASFAFTTCGLCRIQGWEPSGLTEGAEGLSMDKLIVSKSPPSDHAVDKPFVKEIL
jgi:hypothetical protein